MTLIVSRFQTADVIAEEGEPHHKAEKSRVIISGLLIAGRVDRDAGAVSVSIPRLLDGSMAAGKAASKPSLWQNERLRFIVCFCGVFVCYFYYGILQETM